MKFSPDVNHKPVVNWWKNFGHSTIDMSATPLFVSKLWERLAPVLFEISQKKFFWWGSRPIWVTQWKEFQISVKKWRFEIFRTSALSRGNRVIHGLSFQYTILQLGYISRPSGYWDKLHTLFKITKKRSACLYKF